MTNVRHITDSDVQAVLTASASHETSTQSIAKGAFMTRIIKRLKSAIESHVPLGHQDEAGFHYDKPQ